MSDSDILKELRDRKEAAEAGWLEIRTEAEKDMAFVGGNPWTADDLKQRKDRPTVAPEEMSQYRNQVINGLMANPRGMKFSPTGNGANDKGATFYMNKARETEYRSHAALAYITAAQNAIERSYGFVKLSTRYASPRSVNQEIWIEALPDPDLILIDPDAIAPDSSDMQFAFEMAWTSQSEHKKKHGIRKDLGSYGGSHKAWVQGDKILEGAYWTISTRKRKLLLVQPPAPQQPQRMVAPQAVKQPDPMQVFEDELPALKRQYPGLKVVRELRDVDYPSVKSYFTNGIDILGTTEWPGKYIPIISCYGKVLYVPEGGMTKKKILSMTRFGRDPWKAYCYACSQQLEVLGMVPKAPLLMVEGQMDNNQLNALAESLHTAKAALTYKGTTAATGQQVLAAPVPIDYPVGQHLQSLELVKEGFRRAIQSAMGSNFLPTSAQRRNEKSGKALDKMEQSAAQGTYHFIYAYEGMIRRVGVVFEDLVDKIHDYMGDVGVIEADGKASDVRINDPDDPESVSTKGDYLCTVSSGPSSDSEREAADDFTETVVSNLKTIVEVSGPKAAAKILAHSVRMRTELGAMGEQLADIISPPEPNGKDGKPVPPEVQALHQQLEQMHAKLQEAGKAIETKQIEQQGKQQIEGMRLQSQEKIAAAKLQSEQADRETKLAVAELGAKVTRLELFLEERARLGVQAGEMLDRVHAKIEASHDRVHELNTKLMDHAHATVQADQGHDQALEQGDQSAEHGMMAAQQAADLAPEPAAGAGA